MELHINSDYGQIGSFWWVNANTSASELHNATYNGSVHTVWREGASGWYGWRDFQGKLIWRFVK